MSLTEEQRDAIIASGGLPDQKVAILGAFGGTALDGYLSYKDAKTGTATQTEARRFVEQQAGDGVERLRTLTDNYMINNPTDERVGRISAMDAELNSLNTLKLQRERHVQLQIDGVAQLILLTM